MVTELLLVSIEAAKKAIAEAENDLQELVGDDAGTPRAGTAEIDELVQEASSKLSAAKAKLVDLRTQLVDLEETTALARLKAARTAVDEAERGLDEALGKLVVVPGADTTWVGKAAKDAFAKLRLAKTTLEELEVIATDED
jgi:cob(I)alamin adenosyltransferase